MTFVPHQVSMVLLKRPEYRAMLEGYLELQRSVAVRLDSPLFENPLTNLPYLYQLWGWLQSIDVLLQVGADAGYQLVSTTLIHHGPGEIFVKIIPHGQIAVELLDPETGTRVRLYPERSFNQTGQLRSLSFSQRPDITIEVLRPNESPELYVLDPKYKLDGELSGFADSADEQVPDGQPKKVDIDKMHAYRDAIRDDTDQRVVQFAAILYPGPEVRYGSGIEALRALPGHDEVLRNRLWVVLNKALVPVKMVEDGESRM